MSIPKYFSNITRKLNEDSTEIKDFFSTHRPTAGDNREDLIANFLEKHLPHRYVVSNGLIYSGEGEFSNEADIIICDRLNNAPLFGNRKEPIWPVEAVYGLIEVKTKLTPSELDDCINKCKKFKSLKRSFSNRNLERIRDSLFVVWAFESSKPENFKETIIGRFKDLNINQKPDFIIVPGRYVVISGQYQELVKLGQSGSLARNQIESIPNYEQKYLGRGFEMIVLNEHSLLSFMIWLSSWLHQAGERYAPLTSYLPKILESHGKYNLFT